MSFLILHPAGHACLLVFSAWLLRRWIRPSTAAVFLGLALAWLVVWSLPMVSQQMVSALEEPFPPALRPGDSPTAEAIVVLGGAVSPPLPGNPSPNLQQAADRVWHTARLYRAGRAPLVLLSGGSNPDVQLSSEASAMKVFLLDLGVPDAAIALEENSRTTRQNAAFSSALLKSRGIQRILLVTSAWHMGRAVRLFEQQGLQVLPSATDHQSVDLERLPWAERWVPDFGQLEWTARAWKEMLGAWRDRWLPPSSALSTVSKP